MSVTPTPSRALATYVQQQVAAVHAAEAAIGDDDPEGVHDLRVAMRRLRATLRTYRHLVDGSVTEPIRAELRALSLELGVARDLEVVHERLSGLLGDQPAGPEVASARRRLDEALADDDRRARETTAAVLESPRYRAAVSALDALAASPPPPPAIDPPLPRLLAGDLARTRRRALAAGSAHGAEERQHQLHETRKATKRLRYAAEIAVPVLGVDAQTLVQRAKTLQTLLGEHHDTVLTRARLRELGAGDDDSVWSRLHHLEAEAATRLEQAFWDAWAEFEPDDDERAAG